MPTTVSAGPETREFLLKVIDVLLDFVKATNDRNEKVLDFHHPEDMKRLLDLEVPDRALPLQQLIEDCATTLKYQVKTGKLRGKGSRMTKALAFPGVLIVCLCRHSAGVNQICLCINLHRPDAEHMPGADQGRVRVILHTFLGACPGNLRSH